MKRIAVLVLVLAARLVAQGDAAAPDFDMVLLPVRIDPAMDLWARVPTDVAPGFQAVSRVCPHDVVMLLAFFTHMGTDSQGRARVTLDVHIEGPEGGEDLDETGIPAWDGPPPEPGHVGLSQAIPGYMMDDKEPPGLVTVTFTAHDEVGATTVVRQCNLELAPWDYGTEPVDEAAFHDWYERYHQAPQPAQAVRAFLEHATFEQRDGKGWNHAEVGFFRTLFEDRPRLVEHLVATAREASEDRRARTAMLLQLLSRPERLADLYPDEGRLVAARAALASIAMPDAYGPLQEPGQLDLLWGEFFASGRYAPVRQIVRALDLADGSDPIATFKASAQTDADRAALMRGVSVQAAAWSLRSNIGQHCIVRDYARWMLDNEDLTPRERAGLAAALEAGAKRERAR